METPFHKLADLFRQLGLADDPVAIERFIATHRPLPEGIALCDAAFWSASQAQFLRESIHRDADWAEIVDSLAAQLSA